MDDLVDDRLAIEARRRGMSKAALIRQLINQWSEQPAQDPVDAIIGAGDGDAVYDMNSGTGFAVVRVGRTVTSDHVRSLEDDA